VKKFFIGVKAVIVQSERILLLERNCSQPFWEVPGGRVDENETSNRWRRPSDI